MKKIKGKPTKKAKEEKKENGNHIFIVSLAYLELKTTKK